MNKNILKHTVQTLLTKGKGILAADETPGNIGKKFQVLHIDNTSENRRRYREMLFSAEGIENYISGVILQDETLNQFNSKSEPFPDYLDRKGILSGIKVDLGVVPFKDDPIQTITTGLDGLGERLERYKDLKAVFAKWRGVIHIDPDKHLPSMDAIEANVTALADYAALCQQYDIVPIVEPEVLMDGTHDIEGSFRVTSDVLKALFEALSQKRVDLEGILLKPNMVLAGLMCANQPSPQDVARRTLDCFKETIPSAVPGIVFLSGGQSDELAIQHLALMNQDGGAPWVLSFSYGRALQRKALTIWKGQDANAIDAQAAFLEQAQMNSRATLGLMA